MRSGEDLEQNDDAEPAFDSGYFVDLSEHVRDTLEHYQGRDKEPLPPSFFPPSSYWTSQEKDAFFHGLVIHSRLRPDLIAAEIKTKSVMDVCIYLDMLEDAASRSSTGVPNTVNPSLSNFVVLPRRDFPAALEVSDEWIAIEEQRASDVILHEAKITDKETQDDRDNEIRSCRSRIRAKKGESRTAPNGRDREGEKRRKEEFEQWLQRRTSQWDVEDLLRSLDSEALTALDRILRDDEQSKFSGTSSEYQPIVSQKVVAADLLRENSLIISRGTSPSPDLSALPTAVDPTTVMIDPVLLSISGSTQEESIPAVVTLLNQSDHFQPITPPFQTRPLPGSPGTFAPISGDGPSTSKVPVPVTRESITATETDNISPASRRRHQKRLYMRRKRARATGAAVEQTVHRLKPGRKRKGAAFATSDVAETDENPSRMSQSGSATQMQVTSPLVDILVDARLSHPNITESSTIEQAQSFDQRAAGSRRSNASGMTRVYKIGEQLADLGIDVDWLYGQGLALFRLTGLARLMKCVLLSSASTSSFMVRRLNDTLNDLKEDACSRISLETIKLLHLLVVKFLTRAIYQSIVLEEQERIAKTHTKVWRMSENDVSESAPRVQVKDLCHRSY